jgi:hypothetical protein
MIAIAKKKTRTSQTCWHPAFLQMLPTIERYARFAFRHLKGDTRNEAVQEAVCNTCQAYARLVEQNRGEAATPRSLARYAVAQVRAGRLVGQPMNVRDVMSTCCQRRHRLQIQPLCAWDSQTAEWQEILVEDRTVTPAELAASRIDYAAFLKTLGCRERRIAQQLARGESAGRVAQLFGISAGRVSQLRQELKRAWQAFHNVDAATA